jgi:hypothetical protein
VADRFGALADTVTSPATRALVVTPHDANPLADIPKAVFVGTGGTIVMRGNGDAADQTWKNIPSGAIVPFRPSHIRAAGTTAADMLALY